MLREHLEIVGVDSRDDGPAGEIADSDYERVNSSIGSSTHASQQLTGSHADSAVDGIDLDPLSSKPREDSGIAGTPPNHLGEYRRDCGDR